MNRHILEPPRGTVLIGDPAVHAVPVEECAEALIDIADVPELQADGRLADPEGHHRMLRTSVVERLVDAAATLPSGWRIRVVEGLRPLSLQQQYFDDHSAALRREHPEWPDDRIHHLATRHVAPPDGTPPHATGGAVDLTLAGPGDEELDLGSPVNATPEESGGRCYTATALPPAAAAHRARLVDALTSVGMVNYPTEWWHWSYGDRYWALTVGAPSARYGVAVGTTLGADARTDVPRT